MSIMTPPAGAPPDLVAAWPAMCPPVRARYAAEGGTNRARALAVRWLRWQAARRLPLDRAAHEIGAEMLPADARILAIQPDHLGGVLLTTPAFRLIKAALPTAHLTTLCGPWAEDVTRHCPAVDRTRSCPFPGFERTEAIPGFALLPGARVARALRPYGVLFDIAAELRRERYHLAVNFHADFWWGAALAALAAIPLRVGYQGQDTAGFLTHALPLTRPQVGKAASDSRPHVAEMHLALAHEVLALAGRSKPDGFDGRMAYEPSTLDKAEAWRLWRANDLDEAESVVAVHPAPGAAVKRWPPERFALVADHVAGRYGARVVVTGGPGDVEEARAVAAACRRPPLVLAGQTGFGVLGALFDRCRIVIGTDNGALHLASARGVPTLRLFGPTDARSWRDWSGVTGERETASELCASIACSPCHRLDVPPWNAIQPGQVAYPCLRDITADGVIMAVEQLWPQSAKAT